MYTVISAMTLDYPPEKLAVYLSDDGGSFSFPNYGSRFAGSSGVKTRCPEAYFTSKDEAFDAKYSSNREFVVERKKTKQKHDEFKDGLETTLSNSKSSRRDHPAMVQVMNDETGDAVDSTQEHILPLLVYVAREKRHSHPHHFKAGALNVLLRVSAMISNAPYFLVLDCDMYCNDPTSARQAIAYGIYDRLRHYWVRWEGADGIRGPIFAGYNFYMRREALYELIRFLKTRWAVGLMQIGLSSKFCPLIYDSTKMPILESMMYAAVALDPLYIFPFYGLALIPQICLIHGIPLYPKVSDPFFIVFPFLFFSSQLKHLIELFLDGDSIRTCVRIENLDDEVCDMLHVWNIGCNLG